MGRCSDAKDRLLATTARLLHERGYTALSVSDICDSANLKKGSFYHFFPSKRDLVLATIDHYGQRQAEALAEALRAPVSTREKLGRMVEAMGDRMAFRQQECGRVHGCPIGNLALEMAEHDDAIRLRVAQMLGHWQEAVETALRGGIAAGEFELDDPRRLAAAVVAFVQGATLLAKAFRDANLFCELAPAVLSLLEGSIKPTSTSVAAP